MSLPPPPMPPTPANPYASPGPGAAPLSPSDERLWAILTHVFSIFFSFVAGLVLFLLFKDRGPFVRAHVVTEWNFQLTIAIVDVIAFVLAFGSFVLSFPAAPFSSDGGLPAGLGLFFVGYALLLITSLLRLVFCIVAAVKASPGVFYRIPIAIRFVK